MVLVIFGPFWVQSGHKWRHKGGKILNFGTFDFTIDFLVLKNVHMPIFRSNQSFQCVLWCFWSVLGRFGYKRGSVTSQRESRFYNFEILTLPSAFSSQKTYPCQFLEQNQLFFVSYCILGEVLTIFSYEWGIFRGTAIKLRVPTRKMKISQNFFLKVSRYMIWKR